MVEHLTQPNQMAQIIQYDRPEILDATANWLGKRLAEANLTNNQIRNVFGTARQIEAKWRSSSTRQTGAEASQTSPARRDLILLKPKLAYQAARHESRGRSPLAELRDWLTAGIDAVVAPSGSELSEKDRFKHFMEFFEAVLAYHYEAEVAKEKEKASQMRRGR